MMSTDITLDPNSPHVKFSDLGITPTPVEKVRVYVCALQWQYSGVCMVLLVVLVSMLRVASAAPPSIRSSL